MTVRWYTAFVCSQANSASYPQRDGRRVRANGKRCAAEKVTVRLASYWACVTYLWYIHLWAKLPKEGD